MAHRMNGPARRAAHTVLAAALALAPAAARAAPSCAFGVAGALAFGTYDPLAAAPADSTTTLAYRCPPGQGLRVLLDAGLAGTFGARVLTQGSERLLYNLYLDAQRTIVWGDGTSGSSVGPGVVSRGAGGTTTAYLFGRIPAGQDAVAGLYGDTIRITFEL